MRFFSAPTLSVRRLSITLTGLSVAVVAASSVFAQDEDDPLRFLKPRIGQEQIGEPVAPDDPPMERIEDPAQILDELRPGEDAAAESPASEAPDVSGPPVGAVEVEPPAEGATAPAAPLAPSTPLAPEAAETAPPASAEPAAGPAAPEPELREPLRFAVLAGRSVAATLAALAPVQRELSAILERPVEILPISSYEAMIDAQDQRRIDGGFFSAAAFAFAQARCRCLDALVAPRASDGTLAYHAIIVARTGSGIGAVADLKGKTVAILAGDSLGARRMQLAGLLAAGNDPAQLFGAVLTVGSAEEGVRMVAAGSADAAFAWSSLSGAPENGYSRGTLTDLVAQGEVEMSRIAVIWHSPAIAHSPFAVLQAVPEDDKSRIERFMLSLATAHPEAYDVLNPFYAGGYATVDAADYSGLAVIASRDVDALALPEAPARTGTATEPIASPAP